MSGCPVSVHQGADVWPADTRTLTCSPPIYILPGFLSTELCGQLIAAAEAASFSPSTVHVSSESVPTTTTDAARRSKTSFPVHAASAKAVVDAVARLFPGLPRSMFEPLQVTRYNDGDGFDIHDDALPLRIVSETATRRARDGALVGMQRVATALLYLQAPISGGETVFPDVPDGTIRPVAGTCVLFFPCTLDGGGLPVHGMRHFAAPCVGTLPKYVAQVWVRAPVALFHDVPSPPPAASV